MALNVSNLVNLTQQEKERNFIATNRPIITSEPIQQIITEVSEPIVHDNKVIHSIEKDIPIVTVAKKSLRKSSQYMRDMLINK